MPKKKQTPREQMLETAVIGAYVEQADYSDRSVEIDEIIIGGGLDVIERAQSLFTKPTPAEIRKFLLDYSKTHKTPRRKPRVLVDDESEQEQTDEVRHGDGDTPTEDHS